MAEHSPEQDRPQEPGGLPEALGPDGREGNPLAQAYRSLREGRGPEAEHREPKQLRPRPALLRESVGPRAAQPGPLLGQAIGVRLQRPL